MDCVPGVAKSETRLIDFHLQDPFKDHVLHFVSMSLKSVDRDQFLSPSLSF